jgi:hypothetical protein
MRRAKAVVAVLVVACGPGPAGDVPTLTTMTTNDPPPAATVTTEPDVVLTIPRCEEIPHIYAPEEAYGEFPMYFANEMPTEQVREWAHTQPGFESIWIDREHNGWITVAFSEDLDARQADLDQLFPGVGVVAVQVDWSVADLLALQDRVFAELRTMLDTFGTMTLEDKGIVQVMVGVVTDDMRFELESRFAGEPLCIEGKDPSTLPEPGPQSQSGDGWRLLFDGARVGRTHRTGIAFDAVSLDALWTAIGLNEPLPAVDFLDEVVIWFGAVFGGGCENIRLDDVVVVGSLVHALIVMPDPPAGCHLDANPHTYVVAVERSKLPVGPFAIQLHAEDPPRGATEERTIVEADLSKPGSVAGEDDVGPDPNFPPPFALKSGDYLEPGNLAQPYVLDVSCGIEWLGELNTYQWRTDESMPPAWEDLVENGSLRVDVVLIIEADPVVQASAGGATLTYRPTNEPAPEC